MQKLIHKVEQVAYHRNGVSGLGFHAILFKANRHALGLTSNERLLASVFEETGAVSVVSLNGIERSGVTFGENSWRGDQFEPELRAAIALWTGEAQTGPGPRAFAD